METKMAILLVNFGGPRSLEELEPFLCELLCDRELIRTRLPTFLHNFLFRRLAKKRAIEVRPDYEGIGGKSPIYETTETLAQELRTRLHKDVLTFHRYLPATHAASLAAIEACGASELAVFSFFPQFSFATTGSIQTFFKERLSNAARAKLRWLPSYPAHPAFIAAWHANIRDFLKANGVEEKEAMLLCSAHGLPKEFIKRGDPYEEECKATYQAILDGFPEALGKLSYQSQFGRDEWLKPSTKEACEEVTSWNEGRKTIVFIPLAFTSDHIETLFEIEQLYLPIVQSKGLRALRCPALNLNPTWIDAILKILS